MEEPINNEVIGDYFIVNEAIEENSVQPVNDDAEPITEAKEAVNASTVEVLPEDPAPQDATLMEVDCPIERQITTDVTDHDATNAPSISVAKVLSVSQIDEMFEFNERKDEEEQPQSEVTQPATANDHEGEHFDLNPEVTTEDVKAAQEGLKEVDVLVCGSCHTVVHFIEEFSRHKPLCKRKSDFHGNIAETKPHVWAFLLWKSALSRTNTRGTQIEESSWKLYQKWCKMPETIRNCWVRAGESVMKFSTFGQTKQIDSLIKPLPPKKNDKEDYDNHEERPVVMRKLVQRDATGGLKEIKSGPGGDNKKSTEDTDVNNHLVYSDPSSQGELHMHRQNENEMPRVGFTKVHKVKGKDGEADTLQEEEFVVEKIVSRRFNPRKKEYEYLLKWEGYPSEQNTWEPANNLEACQHLLKAFEENLSKQQMNKQKSTYKQNIENTQPASTASYTHGGRPIRYSKQKALSQVKQWCGSIKPDDAELEFLKRKLPVTDSDDEEDPFLKKMRLERETDSEDSMGPNKIFYSKSGKSGIMRRPGRPPSKPKITNGTTESLAAVLGLESSGDESKQPTFDAINRGLVKKSNHLSVLNQQILVANAKGVVKVDPEQVPNLASGVYIMSNKSGIIKLDSVSPSKALSLKGVSQPAAAKQSSTNASAMGSTPGGSGVTSTSQSGVIMVNRENQGPSKSGIMRRPGLTPRGRGVGRPPSRPQTNVRVTNPNTRLIHSGSRSNVNVTPGTRPRVPLKSGVEDIQRRTADGDKRILGPKTGRGGINRGGMRGSRGASHGVSIAVVDKKELDPDNVFIDLPQESSSDSDAGLQDLFPSGKVLLKAEGEKTPQPTPPQSPKQNALQIAASEMITLKDQLSSQHSSSFMGKVNNMNTGKETLVKKTLKPGSIGSMSVSPKKNLIDDNDDIVTITGDDGLIFKVRKSELNNTLLVSGEDGQQCVYVATGEEGDENATVLTLDPSYADTVAQLGHVNILGADGDNETQFYVKDGEEGELVSLQVQGSSSSGSQEGTSEDNQSQVVAQLVETCDPPPGGGPRKVVLLLPDGNLMMTEVDEEQYAALELDKYQPPGELE